MQRVVPARPPLRELRIERMLHRVQRVAERLEQPTRDLLAARDRQDREPRLQRQHLLRQFRTRVAPAGHRGAEDRKSTRLNSSHVEISYAVFCLKKKKKLLNIVQHLIQKQTIYNPNQQKKLL